MENADLLIQGLNAKMTSFNGVQLYLPDPGAVAAWHKSEIKKNPSARFPFWAKLWPSSIAISEYLSENSSLFAGKTILEIAGGLGLPSLVAASVSREVIYTDLEPAAVLLFSKLIALNRLTNIHAFTLDWNMFPSELSADIVLLSDVNYDEKSLDTLFDLIMRLLEKGSVVVLSTPMRLIGREFIARLAGFAFDQQLKTIRLAGSDNLISIIAFRQPNSI
ncbi:MAG TPA: hypothetical protein VLC28_06685 [Flavitalea sp.]|nr:hypothetical protein [Flavitalea sp.]